MDLYVRKSRLEGFAAIPASKSHTIRAVAVASLAEGESRIRNPLVSSDTISAVKCYRGLGAEIDNRNSSEWVVKGVGGVVEYRQSEIDVGNSGTTLRIALSSAALERSGGSIVFTGDEQVCNRSIGPLVDALNKLGAECIYLRMDGKAPVDMTGQIKGGKVEIECETSQFLSSLLINLPVAENDSEIIVSLLNEPGYVQMTLDWLDKQGIEYQKEGLRKFTIKGGQEYTAFDEMVPADFSSATFFLVGAALFGGKVEILGLDMNDSQPDKLVIEYLERMGARIELKEKSVLVYGSKLKGIDIDMNATPDALPAMAVAAAYAEGTTQLYNVAQARKKETDRIRAMAEELEKIGVKVDEKEDGLLIQGGGKLYPAKLNGRKDHRIVMALSLACMGIEGDSVIETAEAVSVTFPNYVELMQSIGANMGVEL